MMRKKEGASFARQEPSESVDGGGVSCVTCVSVVVVGKRRRSFFFSGPKGKKKKGASAGWLGRDTRHTHTHTHAEEKCVRSKLTGKSMHGKQEPRA
jgi:hypothetical protein